jgi:hypothetical protein
MAMSAKPRNLQTRLSFATIAAMAATSLSTAFAQNGVLVLPPVYVAVSSASATPSNPVTFGTNTVNLTCPATGISAIVSSTSTGTAKVLTDNYITLSVAHGTGPTSTPVNICSGGVVENGGQQDCFTTGYQAPASEGLLTGEDPDGAITAEGGISPIQIGSYLASGVNAVTLSTVDTGVYLAASSIYLNTNCTQGGVSGTPQVNGNIITTSNPQTLTQTAPFSTGTNTNVQEVFDLSTAENEGDLNITPDTFPITTLTPLSLGVWQREYVQGTSFSTANCLLHYGALSEGRPACAIYKVVCQVGQGTTPPSGAQCPTSSARNEVFEDVFDGPAFNLPDIHVGNSTFHQGIGYLMTSDGWTGGACSFDPSSGVANDFCPFNLLTQFSGAGGYGSKGTTNSSNSSFVTVAPVPEDSTSAHVWFSGPDPSVPSLTVHVDFFSKPPSVPLPNNDFVAAPIASVTYGYSLLSEPLPSTLFPVPGDIVVSNTPCPAAVGDVKATDFYAPEQTITFPGDGQYLLHYFATDCAGTEELKFVKTSGTWSTTFYTTEIDIDTTAPMVVSAPALLQAPATIKGKTGYPVGSTLQATYACADALSGVQTCGTAAYPGGVRNPSPVVSTLDTSTPGTKTFTVNLKDAANNHGTPQSITYTVINP